jgi:hypothetical protein
MDPTSREGDHAGGLAAHDDATAAAAGPPLGLASVDSLLAGLWS